ncbi:MAG: hypothetical protein IJ955_05565, partial [Oscillospiraceae bacterium]|nr:hypothetical protein [Oscillospiraceae bacterium]
QLTLPDTLFSSQHSVVACLCYSFLSTCCLQNFLSSSPVGGLTFYLQAIKDTVISRLCESKEISRLPDYSGRRPTTFEKGYLKSYSKINHCGITRFR